MRRSVGLMNTRLFLLSFALAAVVPAGQAAKADTPAVADASPTPTVQYGYVTKSPSQPNADPTLPQIFEVDINAEQLSAPGPLAVRVLTSANAVTVYAHVEGQTFGIPLTQAGQFELAVALPTVPPAMRGRNYTFDFEALTADGKRTQVDIPVFIVP